MEDPRPADGSARRADARVRSALADAAEVLFLCSGNIMRSAFAELYARHRGLPLPVRSAGTTYWNSALHPATARALTGRGVARSLLAGFRPTHLDTAPAGPRTVVFGMTRAHLEGLGQERAFLASELRGRHADIPDPIDHPDPGPVFAEVARCVDALVALCGDGARH